MQKQRLLKEVRSLLLIHQEKNYNGSKESLKKAEDYAKLLNMSQQGIYDQLTSKYGEAFNKEDVQYAIDHLDD